jgi:hypothetical protein
MKKKPFLPLLIFVFLFLVIGGCDLLDDKEHCQDETHDSKIWTPEQYTVVSYAWAGDVNVHFTFTNSGSNKIDGFKLSEVCPYSPIVCTVKINEKNPLLVIRPKAYYGSIIEIVENGPKMGYVEEIKGRFEVKQVSDFVYQGDVAVQLEGFEDQGGRDIYIEVEAYFFNAAVLPDQLSFEKATKECVASVEYTVAYDKW